MARVLLVDPSYMGCYGGNRISVVNPVFPVLSLASALPEETLFESAADAVAVGEADYSFADICDSSSLHVTKRRSMRKFVPYDDADDRA